MAVPSPEPGLPFRVHGLHPLQGQGGRADLEPGGLCGAGCHDGGVRGDTQHYGRGQREFQVLDGDAQRPEEVLVRLQGGYNAPNEKAGLDALADIREKWGEEIPLCRQQLGEQLGRCQFLLPVPR